MENNDEGISEYIYFKKEPVDSINVKEHRLKNEKKRTSEVDPVLNQLDDLFESVTPESKKEVEDGKE